MTFLTLLTKHKGKSLFALIALAALLLGRGCRFDVQIDPVRASTNEVNYPLK